MISKDTILRFYGFLSSYLFGVLVFVNPVYRFLLGISGYIGIEFYLVILKRREILRGDLITNLNLIRAVDLPNTLLIDNNQSLYAVSGILFFSTVETEDYLDRIRFQDQFSIIHIENQLGSVYLVIYELLLSQSWINLSEEIQSYHRKQIEKNLGNVQGVLNELIPGFKKRMLSITELSEECGFFGHFQETSAIFTDRSTNHQGKDHSNGSEFHPLETQHHSLNSTENFLQKFNSE